jgi:hypothetical protein
MLSEDAKEETMRLEKLAHQDSLVPTGGEPAEVMWNNERLRCGHTSKLLDPPFRFAVFIGASFILFLFETPGPILQLFNPTLTKRLCGVAADSTRNKIWSKNGKFNQIAGGPVYLTIQDKGALEEEIPENFRANYILTDQIGLRIGKKNTWFHREFATEDN